MINKICPICGSKLHKKEKEFNISYFTSKTKSSKKLKIYQCDNCGFNVETNRHSFDKLYKKDFIKLRDNVTKKHIEEIKWINDKISIFDLEKILYLNPNFFYDIKNGKIKVDATNAALITILYNFPFIFKCAAHNYDTNACIEYMKEFISNVEKTMNENAKNRVNEILDIKEESVPISKKE